MFYFEHLLSQALNSIDGTSIIGTITNIALAILLVGFLVGLYQAALRGGDLQALAVTAIKYLIVAMIVSHWTSVFRDVNGSFTSVADFVSNSSSAGDMFANWMTQLQQQSTTNPNLTFWDMITGDIPGTIFDEKYQPTGFGSETDIKDTRSQDEHIKNLPVGQMEILMSDNRQGTLHSHLHVRVPSDYRFPGLEPRIYPQLHSVSQVEGANLRFKDADLIRKNGKFVRSGRPAWM